MRKRLLFLAVMMAAFLVAVVGYAYRFHGPGVLQDYVRELRNKGEKVTYQEMVATFSTNSVGCLEVLSNSVANFGPVSCELTNVRLSSAVTELTNMSLLRFVQPGRAQVSFRQPAPPWAGSVSGPRCTTWSGSSNRLSQIAVQLRALRDAMRHLDTHGGPRTDVFQTVTPWREAREAATWIGFASLVELHDGEYAEALANAEALAGLANLHREEYSLLTEMARVGAAQQGLDISWQVLQATRWNDSQLGSLQRSWEAVDLLEGLERAFIGERAFGPEAVRRIESGQMPGIKGKGLGSKFYQFTILPNDIVFRTRNLQGRVEAVRALRTGRPWQDVAQRIENLDSQIERKSHGPQRFLYLVSLVSIPNFRNAILLTIQTETKRRLVIVSIALKRYQLRHDRLPERLDALAPAFVTAVPLDPMSGAPLRYRLNADGTFSLYSVGEDGKDDGGDATAVTSTAANQPPARLGAWGGRDTVWPWPAGDPQPQVVGTGERQPK